ncbi:FAD-dependent pyridine nucleotide-disulfide oxidoreductase [Phaeosphaeriaceae sp. PMI808]|nr:FAD-dependent pyridine nucleotide-disulfide oxidoreductase [Phaeosphaeriaceae sp. PMI808]
MTTLHYNALILGSGQAGTPLATHIKSLGHSVCLVERSHVGGCCVNEGCTPTKTMVTSGRMAYLARRAGEYGVGSVKEVKIEMQKVRQRKRDIVNRFRGGSEKRLSSIGVDVLMGGARFVGPKEVEVSLNNSDEVKVVSADRIFINVGCRPMRPALGGLSEVEQERVLDSTSIQELGEVPEHLVVIGGGVIGLEFGQLFRRLGARVTIIQRGPRLLGRKDDPELAECMQDILKEDGIDILLDTPNVLLARGENGSMPITVTTYNSKSQQRNIKASHILLATGRIPNTDTLDLETAGIITTPPGYIQASDSLETNTQGVYVLGDVKGGPAFTHVSYDDFRILRDNLYPSPGQRPTQTRTTVARIPYIPSVTYTDPQFAHIGPKLLDLPASERFVSYSMPASWIARGLETDETRGMLKAIVSFSAIAVEGGEIMSVAQMAMLGGLTWMQLRDGVFAHPSWSESLNNLWGGEKRDVGGEGKV